MIYDKKQIKQKIKEATPTRQLKERALELLKEVPLVTYACQKLNIPKSTFYKWKEIDSKFKEDSDLAINLGRSTVNDIAVSQLMKKINEGETLSIIFWLKHNSPMFNQKMTLQIEKIASGYSKDELDVLVTSLKGVGYDYIVNENNRLTENFKKLLKDNAEEYNKFINNEYRMKDQYNEDRDEEEIKDRMVKIPEIKKEDKPKPELPKLKYGIKRRGVNIAELAKRLEAKKKAGEQKSKVNYRNIIDRMGG